MLMTNTFILQSAHVIIKVWLMQEALRTKAEMFAQQQTFQLMTWPVNKIKQQQGGLRAQSRNVHNKIW